MKTDAYFAGLFDGEAYIGLARKGPNSVRPYIQINMTCEETLKAVADHFGFGTVRLKKVPKKNKPQWVWRVMYYNAVHVAKRMLPYSITKKSEFLALANYAPKSRGRPPKQPPSPIH